MDAKLLLEWWNLIYIVPFLMGFAFLLMQVIGIGEGDVDADADADVDADVDHDVDLDADVDHDVDLDVDVDVDHDVDVDADADHDADVEGDHDVEAGKPVDYDMAHGQAGHHAANDVSPMLRVALVLGVGKVPLSLVLMTLWFTWGVYGYIMNIILQPILQTPVLFFAPSFFCTLVLTFFSTAYVSKLVAKVIPKTSTFSTREKDLVGKVGQALYKITEKSGTIRVTDQYGNIQQYPARSIKGEIPSNTKVILVSFDQGGRIFAVKPAPEELERWRAIQ